MHSMAIDPRVLELGQVLSEGYTSLAAKERIEKHASMTRYNRKARARAARRTARDMRRAS